MYNNNKKSRFIWNKKTILEILKYLFLDISLKFILNMQ